jgi:hypothetical protein
VVIKEFDLRQNVVKEKSFSSHAVGYGGMPHKTWDFQLHLKKKKRKKKKEKKRKRVLEVIKPQRGSHYLLLSTPYTFG